jgi:hypothetical protein
VGIKLTALAFIVLSVSLTFRASRPGFRTYALLALAVLIPWASVIGTDNQFWRMTFWSGAVSAIVVLEAARRAGALSSLLLPASAVGLLLLLGDTLLYAVREPYRLAAPLALQREPITHSESLPGRRAFVRASRFTT